METRVNYFGDFSQLAYSIGFPLTIDTAYVTGWSETVIWRWNFALTLRPSIFPTQRRSLLWLGHNLENNCLIDGNNLPATFHVPWVHCFPVCWFTQWKDWLELYNESLQPQACQERKSFFVFLFYIRLTTMVTSGQTAMPEPLSALAAPKRD